MKQWVKKLVDQLDVDWGFKHAQNGEVQLTEERATVLFIIDTLAKNLFEMDAQPVRKVRVALDEFAKELIVPSPENLDRILFRFRQFYTSHRLDEFTFVQKTFDDFKNIIWDFADQLSEEVKLDQAQDLAVASTLEQLREAVESNSIEALRLKSREFIDYYTEHQTRREEHRTKKIGHIKRNLNDIKKKLNEANVSLRQDHLTGAFNRKSFDEQITHVHRIKGLSNNAVTMMILDIDHFKRINDSHGHDVGDFALKECVRTLKTIFNRENDFLARFGGEEFAVILPEYSVEHAIPKAEEALARFSKEVYVHKDVQLRFTMSIGIAELGEGETTESWIKRADTALYKSKDGGRNRFTVAPRARKLESVA